MVARLHTKRLQGAEAIQFAPNECVLAPLRTRADPLAPFANDDNVAAAGCLKG